MVGGLSKQIYLPFMLAKQLGYYAKAGVNVVLSDEPAGGDATQNMLAGQVDGVGGFYDHNIALQGQGKSSESVVSMLQIPGEVELCRTDLQGQDQLPRRLERPVARHHRHRILDRLPHPVPGHQERRRPGQTTRRGVGAGTTFIAAMKQKAIACGMTTEPTVSQVLADKTGFILLDMRTAEGARKYLGGTYPATSLYMTTAYVDGTQGRRAEAGQRLRRDAEVDPGAHRRRRSRTQMPPDYYAGVGKDAYAKALDSREGDLTTRPASCPPDGPQTCLAVLSAFNPNVKGKSIDLSKTFTNDFVNAVTPLS